MNALTWQFLSYGIPEAGLMSTEIDFLRDFLDRQYNPRVQISGYADFLARWKQDALKPRESLTNACGIPTEGFRP